MVVASGLHTPDLASSSSAMRLRVGDAVEVGQPDARDDAAGERRLLDQERAGAATGRRERRRRARAAAAADHDVGLDLLGRLLRDHALRVCLRRCGGRGAADEHGAADELPATAAMVIKGGRHSRSIAAPHRATGLKATSLRSRATQIVHATIHDASS
jgi:hypothetical protein